VTPTDQRLARGLIDAAVAAAGTVSIGQLPDGLPALEGTIERGGVSWTLQVVGFAEALVVVRSSIARLVPEDRRGAAVVFANAVNWALVVGDVEVYEPDGTVRVCTSVCAPGTPIDGGLAEGLIGSNVGTAALVFPAAIRVADGEDPRTVAEELLDRIERDGIGLELG
jgi:hypothetical protein